MYCGGMYLVHNFCFIEDAVEIKIMVHKEMSAMKYIVKYFELIENRIKTRNVNSFNTPSVI